MKKFTLVFICIFLMQSVWAQLDSAIINGKVSGYWRNFFMVTQNNEDSQNWNALATGGLLKYETGNFKNFKIGIGYYSTFNVMGNVETKDSQTNKSARYEGGLFNVKNLSQKEIHYVGELYLKYQKNKHEITIGRMKLNTPFLNPQDGRMIPTLEQGVWYQNQSFKKITFHLGWISHIAPRSYNGFETVENSLGIYPVGLTSDGIKSQYYQKVRSAGLGIFSLKYKQEKWQLEVWDYFLENIYNSAYFLGTYKHKTWKFSGQYLIQNQLNNGGHSNNHYAYFQQDMSMLWGLQIHKKVEKWLITTNFNHIANHGRFLFPREWGRETLFTFQKRERLESVGNATAWVIDFSKKWELNKKNHFKLKVGYGHYYRPDVKENQMNKYAMPANDQLNIDIFYFHNKIKFEYLITYKRLLGNTYENVNFEINKVNMWNHNLIMNYQF